MPEDIREQAVDWAIRLHDGDLSDAERQALDQWLDRCPDHARALDVARELMGDAGRALADDPDFTRRLVRSTRKSGRTIIALAFVAALAGGGFFLGGGPLMLQADVISASNEMPVVRLPDGSRVHLNGKSAIAEHFTATDRRIVLLEGEVFFEVEKDATRPFIVEAGAGRIKVTGTAFNVNLLDGGTEVVVTDHTVAVAGKASGRPTRIEAGQKLFYDRSGVVGPVEAVPSGLEVPWRSGRLIFENRPLATVVEEVFRHIPGKVVVARRSVAEKRISGSFDISNPQEALASFGEIFGVRMVKAGNLMTLIY